MRRRAKDGKYWQIRTCSRFPKAGIECDARSHLALAIVPGRGPGPDIKHFRTALDDAVRTVSIEALAADAGYDSEDSHRYAREQCGVRSLLPALIGRPTTKPPRGYWRPRMAKHLRRSRYSQRWQVETVNSMLKRLLGSALRARTYWSLFRDIHLRAITLNIIIVGHTCGFQQSNRNREGHPPLTSLQHESAARHFPHVREVDRTGIQKFPAPS